ncbi:MAG: sigma-70 family RNA polymerase sigma factor [Acidobacteria bacterium]|nr:sigma-70 family RNA polymerase sigma factor [Acidobacteriota bacterium]
MGATNFSNPDFLERVKKGDRAALPLLVEAVLPQLLRAGRGMGFSQEESEDLAHSVFAAFLEKPEQFQGRSHIRTYLFGIFYNLVAERYREKSKALEHDPIDEVMESKFDAHGSWRQPPADIEGQLHAKEIGQIIQECLKGLSQPQRVAFYLREHEEWETPEICKKLGITVTNLGVLLFRARNRLRECVEKKGLKKG